MNAPAPVLSPPQRRVRPATVMQFAALALIWGSTWIVIKDQLSSVPVGWSVAWRFLIAAVAMFGLCAVLRVSIRLPLAGHVAAVAVALMQFAINFNLVYEAEKTLTSGLVALMFALIVVPNTVLSRIFLGSPVSGRFALGAVLGIGGVALLVGRDLDAGPGAGWGLAFAAAAVLCASVGNVIQAGRVARALPLEPLLAWTILYGGLLSAALAAATAGPPAFELRGGYVAGLLYLALAASALAFRLYYALIREIGPARAGYVNVVVPLVAMGLSTVFEDFVWTWSAALGGVLALVGLVVALRSRG